MACSKKNFPGREVKRRASALKRFFFSSLLHLVLSRLMVPAWPRDWVLGDSVRNSGATYGVENPPGTRPWPCLGSLCRTLVGPWAGNSGRKTRAGPEPAPELVRHTTETPRNAVSLTIPKLTPSGCLHAPLLDMHNSRVHARSCCPRHQSYPGQIAIINPVLPS